ncbi:MAG: site-specific integrase [Methanomassiliicoccales archaeon]|jgi:integrase
MHRRIEKALSDLESAHIEAGFPKEEAKAFVDEIEQNAEELVQECGTSEDEDAEMKRRSQATDTNGQQAGGEASLTTNEDFGTVFIPSPPDIAAGREEGDNSRPGQENNESRDLSIAEHNPLGTGEGESALDALNSDAGDSTVRAEDVLRRFVETSRVRLRSSTLERCSSAFRRFAKEMHLDSFTRRQLAGPSGKRILVEHLGSIPRPSWRSTLTELKMVWIPGLNLPWPLDAKRDLGRLPPPRRRESPSDETVKSWAGALVHELDLYLRLLWLLIAQHGWRPSHVCLLKWHHVRYDTAGRPVTIVADGTEAGFKTSAPVAVRLAPDVVEALEAWRRAAPEAMPERSILPWRSCTGRLEPSRENNTSSLQVHWTRMRLKWQLPVLRMVDLRHWVATACRRSGLSKQASAYLMGHDSTAGGAMRDWYDAPSVEAVFEEQADRLPHGPLGLLEPSVELLADGLPKEAIELVQGYFAEEIGTMELATRLEAVRLKTSHSTSGLPEP